MYRRYRISCGNIRRRPRDRTRETYSYGSRYRYNYTYHDLMILRYFYGRQRRRANSWARDLPTIKEKPVEKPKPPKEEQAKTLVVNDLDLKIKENAKVHKTDDYDCTDPEEPDSDRIQEAVVRRGFNMTIRIQFDRPYVKAKHDMKITLQYGEDCSTTNGTKVDMTLNEGDPKTFKPAEWGANLTNIDGNWITVEIHIACSAIVGEWEISVTTFVKGNDKDGKKVVMEMTYEHDVDINILFNPLCKDDLAFCNGLSDYVDEYVLADEGYVYKGNGYRPSKTEWNFGQFEYGILDVVLELLRKTIKNGKYGDLANPIKVARMLAYAINEFLLSGNWSGDYSGGEKPWTWAGSVRILQAYRKNKSIVKFGQCWVFSGVLTTVLRALGIACRSVTNYNSAHDTDGSLTIDKYKVRDENGELEDHNKTSDSIWNFHVWNDVYLGRPDLDPKNGTYNGWQAIDSTPQELSDGIYACGPAPLVGVKSGLCNLPFDTGFVFAECNADELIWLDDSCADGDGLCGSLYPEWRCIEKKKNKIGMRLVTKALGSDEMEDITRLYKHEEDSAAERDAVLNAVVSSSSNSKESAYDDSKTKKVKFSLIHSNDIMIGHDLPIKIKAFNNGNQDRLIVSLGLYINAQFYTGEKGPNITKQKFIKAADPDDGKWLGVGKDREFNYTLKREDYLDCLVENACLKISLGAFVQQAGDEESQMETKDHLFYFTKPNLDVEAPKEAKKNHPEKVTIRFKNPFKDRALTNVVLTEDASAIDLCKDQPTRFRDVPPGGEFREEIRIMPLRAKRKANIAFIINSEELYEIKGSAKMKINF